MTGNEKGVYFAKGNARPDTHAKVSGISGRVFSGLGRGAFFISMEGYITQIDRMFGFKPFPGTLNLKIERDWDALVKGKWDGEETLHPVVHEKKTYGSARAIPASLQVGERSGEGGRDIIDVVLLVLPKTAHSNTVEVIAPVNLRQSMGLVDGTLLEILPGKQN